MLESLRIIHSNGVLHRDIKPPNVLITSIDPIQVCISDFGLAWTEQNSSCGSLTQPCGSIGYTDPDVLMSKASFSERSDIFSLGCVLFKLLTGVRLYGGATQADSLLSNMHEDPALRIHDHMINGQISAEFAGLLTWMTKRSQKERPSINQCIGMLRKGTDPRVSQSNCRWSLSPYANTRKRESTNQYNEGNAFSSVNESSKEEEPCDIPTETNSPI